MAENIILEGPVVGILVLQNSNCAHSYLPASYVKFAELGGAKDIFYHLRVDQDEEYYEKIVTYTNGALIGGSTVYFSESSSICRAVKYLYKAAERKFTEKIHYPILGICLGMELLACVSLRKQELSRRVSSPQNIYLPLQFHRTTRSSKIFKNASAKLIKKWTTLNIAYFNNVYCLCAKDLDRIWDIITINREETFAYVSSIEHKKYPFYGIQFEPQKSIFELQNLNAVNNGHNMEAIEFSQYIANFFVSECRKNKNQFPNVEMKRQYLIYNYKPKFSMTKYLQLYLFEVKDYKKKLLIE